MELLYKKEENAPSGSFFVNRVQEPVLDINWHFHEEFEIIYIIKGRGIRLVGDNLSSFRSGELVLVGPNIPHLWRTTKNLSAVDRIIIKFDELPGGVNLFSIPEFAKIKTLLKKSETGVSFGMDTVEKVERQIIELSTMEGVSKWTCLLDILNVLSLDINTENLSSPYLKIASNNTEENRLSKVISYISENYNKDIVLDNVADIASMTIQSFCRFFKKRTNKTFIQFLNEYRIGKACVLLVENKMTISEICYELGYNSTTNFNRVFKRQYSCTPMEYRKKYANVDVDPVLV
ncbi:MAG: helix-turn-helix domain-containing protein [Cyclobacteriaceae bacterium]